MSANICSDHQNVCKHKSEKISVRNNVNIAKNNASAIRLVSIVLIALFQSHFVTIVSGVRESNELRNAREDVFSSTSKLEELVHNEFQVLDLLTTFTEYTIEKATMIKGYVDNQRRLLGNRKSAKDIVAHPVDAYVLTRRLTADWEDVQLALHAVSNYSTGVYSWIGSFREGSNFPQGDDLNGAAQALVRLQDTYRLNMASLTQGVVNPLQKSVVNSDSIKFEGVEGLTARDLLFLGKHAYSNGLYHRAIEWLQGAESVAAKESNGTMLLSEIAPSLQSAIDTHDDILERQGPQGTGWKTNPVPINPILSRSAKYNLTVPNTFQTKLFQRQTEEEETEHYVRLCRGEKLRPAMMEAQLKCRMKNDGSPYLIVSPLKIEEESHDPYIVIVHDFITEKQADALVELGKPKLRMSLHQNKNGTFTKSSVRTSKSAWIKDWEDKLMIKITRRVELVSGLKAFQPKEAEDYQIANYGLGGLYVPHTDHLMNNPDKSIYTQWERFVGDRIATLMIYLTNVGAGGGTVFPRAGVTLRPRKGSAAFWWNLDKSLVGDENTRHGACAVLYGDKWVSNKWIRSNEQFLKAPCGLHPLDKHKRP
ncbi:prolyl 4-hydroxylase subunit alpha-1 isoform X2 [Folsomia candida]|uniref:prolyl 4-hydroxylase subunit alpha-1 isoform X2 n=1 Tax=Folsomia candida TaxID=158441 RepID=UPI0016055878|nr:prolyl 4-hydroxylase subunit alpha-1 isoform X2 [Folsomia candida]